MVRRYIGAQTGNQNERMASSGKAKEVEKERYSDVRRRERTRRRSSRSRSGGVLSTALLRKKGAKQDDEFRPHQSLRGTGRRG